MSALTILDLPEEIILATFTYLPATSLALVARSCKYLRPLALDDQLWRRHIQNNVPYTLPCQSPSSSSWRHLYIDMSPYWFIPRNRIWISDRQCDGGVSIARYSVTKHRIEAYRLSAREPTRSEVASPAVFWDRNPEVIIAPFNPIVDISDVPMFTIDGHAASMPNKDYSYSRFPCIADPPVFLANKLPSEAVYQGAMVWPPLTLPSHSRVRNTSLDNFSSRGHHPNYLSEISECAFRVRDHHQTRFISIDIHAPPTNFSVTMGPRNERSDLLYIPSTLTVAAIPPEAYTPTAEKPWRGIWLGDYAGHGYEFLAFLQPDEPFTLPYPASQRLKGFSEGSYPTHVGDDDLQFVSNKNLLVGVKLTGDINVPRGEYSFIMPDVGDEGTLRYADEAMFRGARVVSGVGHIAGRGFQRSAYIGAQMFLLSPDRVAMYWEELGHITYMVRVDIDRFVKSSES